MTIVKLFLIGSLVTSTFLVNAQKYTTVSSSISFFSDAAIEDIKAENTKTLSIFNVATGDVAFSIPIKDFEFEKSLMKEHFNEKYMETEKYPKATFQGKVTGYSSSLTEDQIVTATGKLTIHGVTKDVTLSGSLKFSEEKIEAKSLFKIALADYKIKIPQLLWQNIAEEVEVSLNFIYKPI